MSWRPLHYDSGQKTPEGDRDQRIAMASDQAARAILNEEFERNETTADRRFERLSDALHEAAHAFFNEGG
jgi:hypothetical protein